jgi:hypothetical protein
MDGANPYNFKSNLEQIAQLGFKRTLHPPYSPDIAPSDFFLFGWVKGKLPRQSFVEMEDVFQAISEILRNLTADMVRSVFPTWIERLKQIVDTNGDYI